MPPKPSRKVAPKPAFQAAFDAAVALHQQGKFAQARTMYEDILRKQPGHAACLHMLGIMATQEKDHERAVALFDRAIALQPAFAEAHANRGVALRELGRASEAIQSYDKAIALRPGYARAFFNRGNAFAAMGDLQAAAASYSRAIELEPGNAEALANLGNALVASLQVDAAIAQYDLAIRANPAFADGHFNKACALLLKGDLAEGFRLFEWRWKTPGIRMQPRDFNAPLWLGGAPLAGRTILLHSEQGLGDTIQFCRYVPLVAAMGARVLVEVPAVLLGVLQTLDCDVEWIARGAPLPAFDCQCPFMSLPLALGTTLHSIPWPGPYLRSDKSHVRKWSDTLGPRVRPRVGLTWSGSRHSANDRNRNLPLATLLAHLPAGCDYFGLQNEVRDSDRAALAGATQVRHLGDGIVDFQDTAALCGLMDVIVSVDTSVAHLAGALGCPVWVLLPLRPDFRWLLGRSDSPWYSSVRLYRQGQDREWAPVLERVAAELEALAP
ncbi:MAG: tetratricopeptide repeat-containing glycosyltransferase family protein [Pseudomonadota bacterium]